MVHRYSAVEWIVNCIPAVTVWVPVQVSYVKRVALKCRSIVSDEQVSHERVLADVVDDSERSWAVCECVRRDIE